MKHEAHRRLSWKLDRLPAAAALVIVLLVVGGIVISPRPGLFGARVKTPKKAPVKKPTKPSQPSTPPKPGPPAAAARSPMVVLGFNDLGMHCMNQDFSEICLLPPFNNLHAQVIDRSGEEPKIVTRGVQVAYSVPGNTYSVQPNASAVFKTNFWTFAPALFGVKLAPNIGLTGNGMTGYMAPTGAGDWVATGVPVTPLTDKGVLNAYQLAKIDVQASGKLKATTQAVIPVSWEISCNLCHAATPSVENNILQNHDRLHGTNLVDQKPVLCARCHADPALGSAGVAGIPTMSSVMHKSHATRFTPAVLSQVKGVDCYACHPGMVTQCQRDVHYAKGILCANCHGNMAAVGNPARTPWVTEPKCGDCHSKRRPAFAFEEPGKLFKESRGHNGVMCASCHGSPHAITPTVTAADNQQAIALQGRAGTINTCTVCHKSRPDDGFNHTLDDDD